jgi:hypothetical protein
MNSEREDKRASNIRKKRGLAVFQVTIPGDCHEDVRANKK